MATVNFTGSVDRDLLKRGDVSANVDVKPGDIIIIPQSFF